MTRLVLVTGGAGFIGASLVRRLEADGGAIRVVDDGRAAGFSSLDGTAAEILQEDLLTADLAHAVAGVEAVVHLAAQTSIGASIADPIGDLRLNVEGTVRLLEAARAAGVPRLILASSAAALGVAEVPASETTLPRPAVPYGAAKLAAEAYLHAYFVTHGMTTTSIRFANAYGPYALHKQSAVPRFIRASLAGEPLTVFGDGSQTRDFVHVDDLVGMIASVLDADHPTVGGRVFHAGSGRETTIRALAEAVVELGPAGGRIEYLPSRLGDVASSRSDISLAASMLGFEPRWALQDGLAATMAWFRAAEVSAAQ